MKKPIILIGGTAGTGKSTLANSLLHELELDHKLGSGFLRAAIQTETSPAKDPALFEFTFRADDPVANLRAQAGRLRPAITACINRARREGTSLVVEGTHLIPDLFHDAEVDRYFVLSVPDLEEHTRRINGATHSLRQVSAQDIDNIRAIDDYYRRSAADLGVTCLEVHGESFDAIGALDLHRLAS